MCIMCERLVTYLIYLNYNIINTLEKMDPSEIE